MTAATYHITVEQHQDFSRAFQIAIDSTPVNVTGYTFEAQIRERIQSSTAWTFTTSVVDELLGEINLGLADTVTATIPAGEYPWDLVMTRDDGVKIRLLEGTATVKGGVTR